MSFIKTKVNLPLSQVAIVDILYLDPNKKKYLENLLPKTFKLLDFPICLLWTDQMKVIPEIQRAVVAQWVS